MDYFFEVIYYDADGDLPQASYPRAILDYEGNGFFANPNDRSLVMVEADPSDLNVLNGKLYLVNTNGLATGVDYQTRILATDAAGCTTTFGPFDYPNVVDSVDLSIFANDITFSNPHPGPGESITVSAVVHNYSDFDATNFYVHLVNQYDPLISYPDQWVNLVPAHGSTTVSWTITTPLVPAWCPMEVFIDWTNVIAEPNELDNRAIRPFVNGNFNLPGTIICYTNVTPPVSWSAPNQWTTLSGTCYYTGTAVPLQDSTCAGATVDFEIVETGAQYSVYTNSYGQFSHTFPTPIPPGLYTISGEVTDYTLTGTFTDNFVVNAPPCLPDLVPDVTFSPNPLIGPGNSTLTVTVTNFGCAPTTINTLLTLTQTGGAPVLVPVVVPPLAAGATFTYTQWMNFPATGTYTVCAHADATLLVVESSDANNNDCGSLTVLPACPDIVPWVGPQTAFYLCNLNNWSLSYRNTGAIATGGPFTVEAELFTGGGVSMGVWTKTETNLDPGEIDQITVPNVIGAPGSYYFVLRCDIPTVTGGVIAECSEINNVGVFNFSVIACQANLTWAGCENFDVQPQDPNAGVSTTLVGTLQNSGNSPAVGPFTVHFVLSGGLNVTYPVVFPGTLNPGQSTVLTVPGVMAPAPATTTLTLVADVFNEVFESNDLDNTIADNMCYEYAPVPMCWWNFWSRTYQINEPVSFYIGLQVQHLYDASSVDVLFEVMGPGIPAWTPIGTGTKNNVELNCACPQGVFLPLPYSFSQAGTYQVRMTSDPGGAYTECDEGNNVLVVDLVIVDDPDMRVLSQYINPSLLNPDIAEPITFDVTYENIGYNNVNDTMKFLLLLDNARHDSLMVPGLMHGDFNTVSFTKPWSSTVQGVHVARVFIDADSVIAEVQELNNKATRAVVVGQSANLFFQVLEASNTNPNIGEYVELITRIGNSGDVDCEADVVYSYVNDQLDTVLIGQMHVSVPANDSVVVQPPVYWYVTDNSTTIIAEIVNSSTLEYTYDDNDTSILIGGFVLGVSTTSESCIGNADGQAVVVVTDTASAVAPFNFFWSNGQVGSTMTAGAGLYTVSVTDANGLLVTMGVQIGVMADNQAPLIFNLPGSITYTADQGICPPTITWAAVQAVDNCAVVSLASNRQSGDTFDPGSTVVTYTATDAAGNSSTASFLVQVIGYPLVYAGPDQTVCDTSAQTAAVPLDFGTGTWSNVPGGTAVFVDEHDPTTTASGLSSGVNYLVWTASNGDCPPVSDTVLVVVGTPVIEVLGADTVICGASDNAVLAVAGGQHYLWSTGETTSTILASVVGTYTVTVSNGSCSATTSIVVTTCQTEICDNGLDDDQDGLTDCSDEACASALNASIAGPAEFCTGESATLTAAGDGSEYLWSSGETTANLTVTVSGTNQVVVTNVHGCSDTATYTVTANPLPNTQLTASEAAICAGGTVTLTASGAATYQWGAIANDGAATGTDAPLVSTTYTVTGTNAFGCTATASFGVTVDQPLVAHAGVDQTVCGNTAALSATGQGTWSVASGSGTLTNANDPTTGVSGLSLGQNVFVWTVLANGECPASSDSVVVSVGTPVVQIQAPDTELCGLGDALTLAATGGTTYLWSNGSTETAISVSQPGTYQVTATSGNCTASTSVVITVCPAETCGNGIDDDLNGLTDCEDPICAPNVLAAIAGVDSTCFGSTVPLVASGDGSFLWSTGETTALINISAAGTYSVTIINAHGCSSSATASVVYYNCGCTPAISPNGQVTFCAGSSIVLMASSLGASTDFLWSTGATTSSIDVNATGTYSVTISESGNTCTTNVVATMVTPPNNVIYVNDNAVGANNGTSWANAYVSLSSAITAATVGKMIWVAQGTYRPGALKTSTFTLKANVSLYGGFSESGGCQLSDRNWETNVTNLSGDIGIQGDNTDNCARVVYANNVGTNVVVDGFHVRDAYMVTLNGGGLYIQATTATAVSSPTIQNCRVRDNYTANKGGGCYLLAQNGGRTNPTFNQVYFENNQAVNDGGALATISQTNGRINASFNQCTFLGNQTPKKGGAIINWVNAGGITTLTASNNLFQGNSATGTGGAIMNYVRGGATLNCNVLTSTFVSNTGASGGGIFNYASAGTMNSLIDSCTFETNSASGSAGAVALYSELAGGNGQTTIENSLFYANNGFDGGAVSNQVIRGALGRLFVSGSRFLENLATGRGAAISQTTNSANALGTNAQLTVTNTVFGQNVAPNNSGGAIMQSALANTTSLVTVTNSTFFGNMCNGQGTAIFNNAVNTGATVTVTNSIFRQNTSFLAVGRTFWNADATAVTNLSYSLLDQPSCAAHAAGIGTLTCGAGMLFGDALFVDESIGDFHLLASSPALDAGTAIGAPATDIEGNARPQGLGVDMGAYEFTGMLPRTGASTESSVAPELNLYVFPNPTDGAFTVVLDREVNGWAQVFDLQGRLVMSTPLPSTDQLALDLSSEVDGLYLIRIVDGETVATKPVLLNRH
jgi:hypothetical protein